MQALKGPMEVAMAVIKGEGGVLGLYKGTVSTLIREVPGNAAMFGTYEVVKQWMARQQASPLTFPFAGGCIFCTQASCLVNDACQEGRLGGWPCRLL